MYAPLISIIILKKVCEWRVLVHAHITVTVSTMTWGINYVNHSKACSACMCIESLSLLYIKCVVCQYMFASFLILTVC